MTGSPPADLRVALIGRSFMGRVHAQAWHAAPRFFELEARPRLVAACGRDTAGIEKFAEDFGFDRATTDWREIVTASDIDVVDICVPGHLHEPIALAALEAGKHVLCEKPLANTLAEAQRMAEAAETAAQRGIQAMVGFSYRRTPALAYARELIAKGRIGEVRHIRAAYLQDWIVDEDFPLVWRLDKERAGSGALGDIGTHIIDMAQFLTGHRLAGLCALTETFVTSRPLPTSSSGLHADSASTGPRGEVEVDDAAAMIARTDRGALVTLEATRFASGRKNALQIEISGSRGAVHFDFEQLNELWFHDGTLPAAEAGFRRILVTEPQHPYSGAWWPAGHGLGYDHAFVHEIADFVRAISNGLSPAPSFRDGLQIQQVVSAVEASAERDGQWTPIMSE